MCCKSFLSVVAEFGGIIRSKEVSSHPTRRKAPRLLPTIEQWIGLRRCGLLVLLSPLLGSGMLAASIDWPLLGFTQVVSNGFAAPTAITHAGDGSQRLFVVEQRGRIWTIQSNVVSSQPFFDITTRVLTVGAEQGLLGLAFSPGFVTNRTFYVDYTRQTDGAVVISRFRTTPDLSAGDTNSEQIIKVIPKPYNNHNGGQIAFGKDGYLYIGVGDGGSEGDPQQNGQNTGVLLGKLLRIDVEGGAVPYSVPGSNPFVGNTNYAPEIWAVGLRNPWRFSFDRLTGDMFIADVGQNRYESIEFEPAGFSGGRNYGWSIMEGPAKYQVPIGFTNFSIFTPPISWYDHISLPVDGGGAVIGGYVYRGPSEPRMDGIYFFGDFMAGWIWGLAGSGTNWQRMSLLAPPAGSPTNLAISTFGEDEQGRLYLADYFKGRIYRVQDTHIVWKPTFSPAGGIINSNLIVVSCATVNAEIHYTTNGVDPTINDPVVVSGATIQVASGMTNKAQAFRADLTASAVATAIFTNKVGAPVFAPPPGAVTNGTLVSISTVTLGATIYYTENGSTPTVNSAIYSAPITITNNITLSAFGVASGYSNSLVSGGTYSLARAATPVVVPASGPITNGTTISISSATPGSIVYYTLDGSSPTTNSVVYTAPFIIDGGTTVSAIAVASGYLGSAVQSIFFSLVQTAAPVFTPGSGPITNDTSIVITEATPNSTIYYTLDGSMPTTNSTVYTGPILINGGTTVSAFATAAQHLESAVTSIFYSLVQTASPGFNPPNGPIANGTAITISCATPGSTIYYTVDGSQPTTNSTQYVGPVKINGGTTLYAFAVADGYLDSALQGVFYQLVQTASPVFNPASGPLSYETNISISCDTIGAAIYYTSDGTQPTTNSSLYMSPLVMKGDFTLEAFAVTPGYLDSAVQNALYTLTQAAKPVFDPAQGPLTNGSLISISCATSNAIIRYTLDGSDPNTNSLVYTNPVVFTNPVTVTARGYRSDMDASDAQTAFFGLFDPEPYVVRTLAGNSVAGFVNANGPLARFSNPHGICIDKYGNWYVADTGNNVIRKILPSGQVTTFAGSGVAGSQNGTGTNAQFSGPIGVFADITAAVYVSDGDGLVRKITTAGVVNTIATLNSIGAGQIIVTPYGDTFVGSWATLKRVSPDGTVATVGGSGGNCDSGWCANVGVGLDATGLAYAASEYKVWAIYYPNPELFAGGPGGFSDGPRLQCQFQNPQDIVFDSANNGFVNDLTRVREIRADGWVRTIAGTGVAGYRNGGGLVAQFNSGGTAGQYNNCAGICLDSKGNLYVADSANNCIRKISPDTSRIGIADDWQLAHFGRVGIDPNADPDQDGMSNYAEFWAGTDPLDAKSALRVDATSLVSNNQVQVQWQTVAGKTYSVQYSGDLVSWQSLSSAVFGDGSVAAVKDPSTVSPAQVRYYRVVVTGF
jgi:hypothetical protein